jgi:AraC family transcriptional regulator, alkane utilization regulator
VQLAAGRANLLSEVLKLLRLASGVFVRGEFSAPWAYSSPSPRDLAQALRLDADHVILFHLVAEGRCRVVLSSGETATASAGEAVVIPYGDQHSVENPDGTAPVPIATLLPGLPPPPWDRMPRVRIEGKGVPTRILCSYLHCDDLLFHPFLKALPSLLLVRPTSGPAADWLMASVRYALDEDDHGSRGAATFLARLPEILFVDCLRQFIERLPDEETGFLAALADDAVGRALVELHAEPTRPWTVAQLARRVAVSRSILAERFTRSLGVSPMRYLMQWRLEIGAYLLRTTSLSLAEIASRTGYESTAAFCRAFKRHLKESPGGWRKARSH